MAEGTNHVILVVDDDRDIRETLVQVLEDSGYQGVAVENGEEALQYLRNGNRPCMIFLDLMMPRMDGWTFRQEQQLDPALKDLPVVVMTAGGKATGLGAVQVLHKPLGLKDVLHAVETHC